MAGGFVAVPVVPTFKGMTKEFSDRLIKPAEKAGDQAGKAISGGLDGAVKNLEKQVKASEGKLRSLDQAYEKSYAKQEQKRNDLTAATLEQAAAEEKYQKAIESGASGLSELAKVERAKGKVKKATDDLRQAEIETNVAQQKHQDQLDDYTRTLGKLEDAQKSAMDEARKSEGVFGGLRDRLRELGDEAAEAAERTGGLGSRIMDGLGKIGTGALLGVGAKIGSTVTEGIGTAFSSGFDRLASVEQAEKMLGGLGHTTEATAEIMDNAMESVKGTAFGFGEAASMAATFVGAGIPEGEALTEVLTLVGDTAAITGSDLQEMGSIWTKVATSQRLGTEEMNQLMDRGLGVLPELQKHYGVTAEEARAMVTEGKVSFEDFAEIMENMVGGSAQAMGDTFSGSAANMRAALGRLGSQIMAPVFDNAPAVFSAIGGAVDKLGEYLSPLIEEWGGKLEPIMQRFAEWLGPALESAIEGIAEGLKAAVGWVQENRAWLEPLAVAVGAMTAAWAGWTLAVKAHTVATQLAGKAVLAFDRITKRTIFGAIAAAVLGVVSALVYFFRETERGQEMWSTFTSALATGWEWVTQTIGGGIDWIVEKWRSFTGWISDAWSGISALFGEGDYTSALSDAFGIEEDSPIITGFFFLRDTIVGVVDWIKNAWSNLGEIFTSVYENFLKPVFDGLVTVGQWAAAIIGTMVITPIMLAWELLSTAFQAYWEHYLQPVLRMFADVGLWLWETVLQPVFGWISDGWSRLSEAFSTVWNWMRDNVFSPLAAFVTETLWPALQNAFQWIGDKWQWLSDTFSAVWNWIDQNVFAPFNYAVDYLRAWFEFQIAKVQYYWDAFKFYLQIGWMWIDENVFGPIRGGIQRVADWFGDRVEDIKGIWQGFQDKLHSVWVWVDENVFAPIGRGIGTVKGWFQTGVDGIKEIWDGLKQKLADPINWVINFVYNDGIKAVFDGVAEKVGLDARLPEVPTIKFATGGMMPGYTPGRDVHRFWSPTAGILELSGGEPVLRPEVGKVLGKEWVDNVNYVARTQGERGVERYLTQSHFANGGVFRHQALASGGFTNLAGSLSAVQRSHAEFVSRFFPGIFNLTSATRHEPGSYHHTGQATDWQNPATYATQMPSAESKALAQAIHRVFPDTAELIHWPLDGWQNLLNGAPHDYGPGTNAQHANHVHWATNGVVQFDPSKSLDDLGIGFSGGSAADPEASWGFWQKILDAVPSFDLPGFGDWAKVPGAALKTMGGWVKDWAVDQLKKWADKFLNFLGIGGARPATEWADQASEALARWGYGPEHLDRMLQQIQIESEGNPQALNTWDENFHRGTPSGGLLQVIEPTYRRVRNANPAAFEGLPDDHMHPMTNLVAGVGAVTMDWGGPANRWPTRDGYADGGIIDLSNLLTRDFGGLVPHGAVVRNTSGRDEMMLPPETTALLNQFFRELPEVARALESSVVALEGAAEWLAKAADSTSVEGITARQSARRILDLGIDLPGSEAITAVLDGEEALWASRSRHLGHLDTLREKEEALEEARKALAELEADEGGLTRKEQRKLDDAQKAVDEAKAAQAEADSDEKRASAAKKVADAEEKLLRVREDLDESATQAAEKRAEDITKANADVEKAQQELVDAQKAQVMDLDHITLVSQGSIMGMIPQVESLAAQIIGMGAPVAAVNQGLGAVIGSLTQVAGMAGPAGITLGMAFDAIKIGIQLVETVIGVIEEVIEKLHAARMAALQATADGWAVIAEYAGLVVEMQANVSSLQQEIVRGLNDQRVAEFQLRVAQQDRLVAEAEGVLALAEARMALDKEIERGNIAAQLRLMGLHEDWDSYLSFQALAANGMLTEWSDAAIGALFTYEAARARALQGELTARVEQINAEAELARITRENARRQADLLVAQERLIKMSAEVAGIDLVGAEAGSQMADLLVEITELQRKNDSNLLGRGTQFVDSLVGWIPGVNISTPWSAEMEGNQARIDANRQLIKEIGAEYGISITNAQIDAALRDMAAVALTDGDPSAVLRSHFAELAAAEDAKRREEAYRPIWDAEDRLTDYDRDREDAAAEDELFQQVQPLEETIKGLDYTIQGLEQAARAWSEGNDLRGEYLWAARANRDAARDLGVDWQLDGQYATPAVRDQIVKEVTVHMDGREMYTADQVDALLAEVTSGSNVRVTTKKSASTVATARREVGA